MEVTARFIVRVQRKHGITTVTGAVSLSRITISILLRDLLMFRYVMGQSNYFHLRNFSYLTAIAHVDNSTLQVQGARRKTLDILDFALLDYNVQ